MRVIVVVSILFTTSFVYAGECDTPQPDWLFCEDFEEVNLDWATWYAQSPFDECVGCSNGQNDPGRLYIENNSDNAYEGVGSLYMPAAARAEYQGADLRYHHCKGSKRQGCELIGHDIMYYRAWIRLAPDHQYVHHFMSIGGTKPDDYWGGSGTAGCRPNATTKAGTALDFDNDHGLHFYTYFPEMHCDDLTVGGGYCADMQPDLCNECAAKGFPCTNGYECCWGNNFPSNKSERTTLPRGEWVCLEMMVKLNTPSENDGEMKYWMNDELQYHKTGMRWRDIPELQLNRVALQHYIERGDANQSNRIWWDNVIASTSKIGCLSSNTNDNSQTNDSSTTTETTDETTAPVNSIDSPESNNNAITSKSDKKTSVASGCTSCNLPFLAIWLNLLIMVFLRRRYLDQILKVTAPK
ncbi:MAG: hypothetical protein JW841_06315 [Deltaproteobacteria bacterium]|nr:hypothetical protein [Deltaproteobacteria bacterium]